VPELSVLKVLKNLNIDIDEGEFLVLLGPSGCGKSTLLNCIAGLLDVSDGQIFIKGKNVTWEEPKDRGIGMVFQSYALYPQMSVEGNLSFGLKNARPAEGRDRQADRSRRRSPCRSNRCSSASRRSSPAVSVSASPSAGRWCAMSMCSCSTSRCPISMPSCAPICASRSSGCIRLKNTMIYVTHDQIEAMTLADRIAIMRNGIIQQLAGRTKSTTVPSISTLPVSWARPRPARAIFGIRPEHVSCGAAASDQPFSADVEIEVVEPMGADTLVWAVLDGKEFRFRVDGQSELRAGEVTRIGFDPAKASIFDANTELRL
jgi:multiple sugar transport system ATP-binding protein